MRKNICKSAISAMLTLAIGTMTAIAAPGDAWQALMSRTGEAPGAVLVQTASAEACAKAGAGPTCYQRCTVRPGRDAATCTVIRQKQPDKDALLKTADGLVCSRERCLPAALSAPAGGRRPVLTILDVQAGGVCPNLIRFADRVDAIDTGDKDLAPRLIPSALWDLITGTEGQCCEDCWATHR